MRPSHHDTTVRDARDAFFLQSGFPADGGYDEPWSEADFGWVRYRVPNGPARRAALKLHDLHHVATGYSVDWRGESEISAWELGSGAGRYPYAWLIALWGLFTGLLLHPGPTLRAFARGRRSTNLYDRDFSPALLEQTVGELKRDLAVVPAEGPLWAADVPPSARAADAAAFAGWSAAATAFGLASLLPAAGFVAFAHLRELGAHIARAVREGLPCPASLMRCSGHAA